MDVFPRVNGAITAFAYLAWIAASGVAIFGLFGIPDTRPLGDVAPSPQTDERHFAYSYLALLAAFAVIFIFSRNVVRRVQRFSTTRQRILWGIFALLLIVPAAVGLAASSIMLLSSELDLEAQLDGMTLADAVQMFWAHAIGTLVPHLETLYGAAAVRGGDVVMLHVFALRIFLSATALWILAEIVGLVRSPDIEPISGASAKTT